MFADRFHAHILRTPHEVRNALVYLFQNARKHRAWATLAPDPFSSGRWFEGWKDARPSPGARSRRPEPSFLSKAHTWLLSLGWRRHGLLSLTEAPARQGVGPRVAH